MKNSSVMFATLFLTVLIVFLPPSNKAWLYRWEFMLGKESSQALTASELGNNLSNQQGGAPSDGTKNVQVSSNSQGDHPQVYELKPFVQQGKHYISLEDIVDRLPIQSQIDRKDGVITLTQGNNRFQMIRDVPVLNNNGWFEPLDAAPVMTSKDVWVPVSLVERVFKQKIEVKDAKILWYGNANDMPVFASRVQLPKMSAIEMANYLSFLEPPIEGAHVSTRESHLPGAPRPYRNGVHEGIDWYSYGGTGVKITKDTPIHSVGNGVVVRADHAYKEMTVAQRQRILAVGANNDGQTPQYILDKLRGRSVWVQYEKGILVRYVHLDRIPPSIQVGERVSTGDIVGYVGNSGTSDGAKGNENKGLHLHLDLLIYGDWFWKNYSMSERRMILERVFNEKK